MNRLAIAVGLLARVLATCALALLLPLSGVRAADPPTLGGTLGATRDAVVIDSSATVPVLVELTAPEGWKLAESSFTLAPKGHHVVAVTEAGDTGRVTARMVAIDVPAGTDRSALVLAVGLPKPPVSWWPLWPLVAFAGGLGALGAARRAYTWQRN